MKFCEKELEDGTKCGFYDEDGLYCCMNCADKNFPDANEVK